MYKQIILSSLIKQAADSAILERLAALRYGTGSVAVGAAGAVRSAVPVFTGTVGRLGDRTDDIAKSVGYTLGKVVKLPYYDSKDLGPYSDFVQNMKDTELAELYLREAKRLRRRERIEKRKRELEEQLRSEVSKSRYF